MDFRWIHHSLGFPIFFLDDWDGLFHVIPHFFVGFPIITKKRRLAEIPIIPNSPSFFFPNHSHSLPNSNPKFPTIDDWTYDWEFEPMSIWLMNSTMTMIIGSMVGMIFWTYELQPWSWSTTLPELPGAASLCDGTRGQVGGHVAAAGCCRKVCRFLEIEWKIWAMAFICFNFASMENDWVLIDRYRW